ncbi:MAG: thiopurine S-methyltransferase [Pseudomonadota bacterium]
MEEQFWQTRWNTGKIAFHEGAPNKFLITHFDVLEIDQGAHVFVPLCGKTSDLDWLYERGYRVTGIEFNRDAIEEVFERMSLIPDVEQKSGLTRFSSGRLTIWHGDFFLLPRGDVGTIDAVYDRAALVALPEDIRKEYAKYLVELTRNAPQLLISYSYDQSQTEGPPFSVPENTIRQLYGSNFNIERLESADIKGPLAARCSGKEQTWKLSMKNG